MYKTPSHTKQHSNQNIGIPDSHARIDDINPLQLQLANTLSITSSTANKT